MFIQRALVSLTLGPFVILITYLGGLYYFIPVFLFLAIAAWEYCRIASYLGWYVPPTILLPIVGGQWVAAQWSTPAFQLFIPLGFMVAIAFILWQYEIRRRAPIAADWMGLFGGIVILGWLGGHFFRIRGLPDFAWQWTLLAILGTAVADSGAYVVGKFLAGTAVLGRHQLTPRLSPNKTIEGFVGGVVLGTVITTAVAVPIGIPAVSGFLMGLFTSLLSPLGDLSISLLKREAKVKDSGRLLPGHGGALDRVDSLIWSVTIGYYLALFLS